MRAYLKNELGLKAPVVGNNRSFSPAELRSQTAMDVISQHTYWDHSSPDGAQYVTAFNQPMLTSNPMDPAAKNNTVRKLQGEMTRNEIETIVKQATTWGENLVTEMSTRKTRGKPLFNTEWNVMYPNEYRCEAIPIMAAYGALQDWDGFTAHNFGAYESVRIVKGSTLPDPAIGGLLGLGAVLFLRGDVAISKNQIDIGLSYVDTFYSGGWRYGETFAPQFLLTFISRTQNVFFDDKYSGEADMVVASGYSSSGDYSKAKRVVIAPENPWQDLYNHRKGRAEPVRIVAPDLRFIDKGNAQINFKDFMWDQKEASIKLSPGIERKSLPRGALPFGLTEDNQLALGYIDSRYCLAPSAGLLSEPVYVWKPRMLLEAMKKWQIYPGGREVLESQRIQSDTKELSYDYGRGLLVINTPRTQGAVGFLGKAGKLKFGAVEFEAKTPFGALFFVSMKDKPLSETERVLVFAIARAENTNQLSIRYPHKLVLTFEGKAPVMCEPIIADITLQHKGEIKVFCLDAYGEKSDEIPVVRIAKNKCQFSIGSDKKAVYYEIQGS